MSFPLAKKALTPLQRNALITITRHKPKTTQYNKSPDSVFVLREEGTDFIIPLGLWKRYYDEFPNSYLQPTRLDKTKIFTGSLLNTEQRDQTALIKQALDKLSIDRTVLISAYCGYGKTTCGIYLALKLRYRVLVVCGITIVGEQWKETCEKHSNLIVSTKFSQKSLKECDMLVLGPLKIYNEIKKNKNVFKDFGIVIADEVHSLMSNKFSLFFRYLYPQYLIGLSATPDRKDKLDSILENYFSPSNEFIIREEVKPFTVVKYSTVFEPVVQYNPDGSLDWTTVQSSLATNVNRQKLIVDICELYAHHKVLVITKRKGEAISLADSLKKRNVSVDTFIGSAKTFDKSADVLVGITSKVSVGFDSKHHVLVIASDAMDIRQCEGRIRAHDNLVIDIVDCFGTLEKHYELREKWYEKRGAEVLYVSNFEDLKEATEEFI